MTVSKVSKVLFLVLILALAAYVSFVYFRVGSTAPVAAPEHLEATDKDPTASDGVAWYMVVVPLFVVISAFAVLVYRRRRTAAPDVSIDDEDMIKKVFNEDIPSGELKARHPILYKKLLELYRSRKLTTERSPDEAVKFELKLKYFGNLSNKAIIHHGIDPFARQYTDAKEYIMSDVKKMKKTDIVAARR